MPIAQANGIEIAYEEFGDTRAPAILLIMGLGAQLTRWSDSFCRRLADAGYRVVRYDNRDVGLSTKFESAGTPNVGEAFQRAMRGEAVTAPYTLEDMAQDGVGLLNALGIGKAHIVGASMGGMIAQIVAAKHAAHTSSLVSIMSSSGRPGLPPGKPEAMSALFSSPPTNDRDTVVSHAVKNRKIVGSPGYPEDEAKLRRDVETSYDRSYYPAGTARQLVAVLKNGSRVGLLERIQVPTLVIHGADDPLVPVACGHDTAATIPGSELRIIPGMGHAIESGLVPLVADTILRFCGTVRS